MRAIIFANGDAPDRKTIERWITPTDRIIAADGGTRNALSVGITPHVVIGDLDHWPRPIGEDWNGQACH